MINILIIDDSEVDRYTYIRYLRSDSDRTYHLLEAGTLEDGLAVWRSQRPDIVLLDMNLPDGDGLEFLEIIGNESPKDSGSVIVLTGHGNEQIAVQAMKLGAADYLVKNAISNISLATSVHQVCDRLKTIKQLERSQQQQAELYQDLQILNESLEQKVQERTKKLQLQNRVLEEINDVVVTTDLNGIILSWNRGAEICCGYSADEVLGKSVKFIYEKANVHLADVIPPLLANGSHKIEVFIITKSGHRLCINLRISVVNDEQGNVTHFIGCGNDITKRKQAEQELTQLNQELEDRVKDRTKELRRQTERLNLALKSGAIGCWDWDIGQNIQVFDDVLYELYGINPKLEESKHYDTWISRIHPEDRSSVKALLQQASLGLAEYDTEFRVVRPDGSIRFVKAYGMLQRDVEGNSQCIIGINYDISDRKLAEIQLQLFNEELLKATKLKDEFLANMSHELRTPLTAILGMSEILSKEIVGGLVERQHKAVNAIYTSGQHLLALINDILDLSKVAAGKMELHIELVSVKKLCDSSLVFVKQQAFQKDICISCNISDNIKKIAVDERRMRQVLINLLTNAVKFTPVGGNIKLSVTISQDNIQTNMQTNMQRETTAPRQVRFLTPMILFQVRDNGIGIAAKDLPRLFQAFVQIDSSLTREYEGTGLGLAMVKQIVELHDGQVLAESQLARGSCFTVALPYAHHLIAAIEKEELTAITTADSTPAADNTPNNQPNQLVLIAEDNEANIETFREYISAYNYRIIIAKNGLEAVTLAESHRPDIILMDIQMPKMDGLKAIRLIKASAELSSIPIIALTARTMEDDRAICIEAGANEYISKPVQLESLVTTIQQFLTITA